MKNNSKVKLLLKPVLCLLALILITFSCKKETNTVTPLPKRTYTAADVVGAYTIKKSEWTENPLGIGPLGTTWTMTLVSNDQVSDGYLTYKVDSLGILSAPPRPNVYTLSAIGSYDLKTITLNVYVSKDNSTTTGILFMTKQ
jgi:hypothetical protein